MAMYHIIIKRGSAHGITRIDGALRCAFVFAHLSCAAPRTLCAFAAARSCTRNARAPPAAHNRQT